MVLNLHSASPGIRDRYNRCGDFRCRPFKLYIAYLALILLSLFPYMLIVFFISAFCVLLNNAWLGRCGDVRCRPFKPSHSCRHYSCSLFFHLYLRVLVLYLRSASTHINLDWRCGGVRCRHVHSSTAHCSRPLTVLEADGTITTLRPPPPLVRAGPTNLSLSFRVYTPTFGKAFVELVGVSLDSVFEARDTLARLLHH